MNEVAFDESNVERVGRK